MTVQQTRIVTISVISRSHRAQASMYRLSSVRKHLPQTRRSWKSAVLSCRCLHRATSYEQSEQPQLNSGVPNAAENVARDRNRGRKHLHNANFLASTIPFNEFIPYVCDMEGINLTAAVSDINANHFSVRSAVIFSGCKVRVKP